MRKTIYLGAGIVIGLVCALAASEEPATRPATVSDSYPILVSGGLTQARLADLPKGTVLRAGAEVIRREAVDEKIDASPANVREQLRKNAFFVLEQMATRRLLLAEAKRELAKAGKVVSGKGDRAVIAEYLGIVTRKVKVTDEQAKAFYDENKSMVGAARLDQVKTQIRQYLLGKKKQQAADGHVKGLGRRIPIEVSASWVKAQAAQAADNPVGMARRSGRPSLVDFGADGCRSCEMLAPILDKLKKKYHGKANVVFVSVRDEQILAARYGIRSIPVQIFFDKDGKEFFRHVGFWPQDELEKKLSEMGVR